MSSTDEDISRRKFMSSAALTATGAATGLSYFFSKDNVPRPKREAVRVGFIGVGSRGGALLRAMLKAPGSEVVAICDAQDVAIEAAVENVKDAYGQAHGGRTDDFKVLTSNDYRDLLKDKNFSKDKAPDAVVIATPHYLHGPMAIAALEAGKNVYCEKAMAFTIGECQDIYSLAKKVEFDPADPNKKTQVFQVGHQRRYSKMYHKVLELVQGGRIGNVTAMRAQWNLNDDLRRPCEDPRLEKIINWRHYSESSAGLMSEFASHQIDVANMLLDAHPHSVCAMGGQDYPRYYDGRDTSDNVHVIFTYLADWREFKLDAEGKPVFEKTGKKYPVRFSYMSIITNALLGPSEIIFGDEGTIEVSLAGGDFWKEAKVLRDPEKLKQGTNPASTHQKKILKSGSTVAAVKKGRRPPDEELASARDKADWSEFVGALAGEHSPQETLLALDDFLQQIRRSRDRKPFKVSADVTVGLWGAVPALMGNLAMRENRTVFWREFFPES